MTEYSIPTAPEHVFSVKPTANPLGNEEILSHITSKPLEWIPYQGCLIHFDGATYPMRGWVDPYIVADNNKIKALLTTASRHPVPLLIALLINRNKTLQSFNILFQKIFHRHTLTLEYLSPASYNLYLFTSTILTSLNFNKDIANEFSHNIANSFQYDDAYRYRAQDILSELNFHNLNHNPQKEIIRLLEILKAREAPENGTAAKIIRLIKPTLYLLSVPQFKKAFKHASRHLLGMRYDDADRYWACLKGDLYMFTGRSYEDRTKGLSKPITVKVNL